MNTNPAIWLDNVSVRYGNSYVFKNISLQAQRGVFYAVIGLNGSGKTTLFKALTRSIHFTGHIYLDSQNIHNLKTTELSQKISLLSQHNTVFAPLTVWEIVLMGRYPYTSLWQGYSQKDKEISEQALELTQTAQFKNKKIHQLSGGETQRVWLAQKIAQDTPVLLLDEPTQHLDLKQKEHFFTLLDNILKKQQKTILMSTHNFDELYRMQGGIWYIHNHTAESIENYSPKDIENLKKRLLQ